MSIGYENEVPSLFEFIMFYIKLWKTESDSFFKHNQVDISEVVYSFLNEVEALVYDLTKSVLIDADSL